MPFDLDRLHPSTAGPETDLCSDLAWGYPGQELSELRQKVAELYALLRDGIFRYVIVILGNAPDAEEITQEVFLQLYRCLHRGQRIRNVRAWAFRVAHNAALDRKNGAGRLVPLDCAPTAGRRCAEPNPEESVLEEEEVRRVQAAFTRLCLQQQQCLILRAEGLRYRQIAEILGISVANVAQSMHRAIRKLTADLYD